MQLPLVHLVQREIDDGASSVEEIHKTIANLPLDLLERLDPKGARKVQEARIGAMYDLIRKVNEEVAKIAQDLLVRPEPRAGGWRPDRERYCTRTCAEPEGSAQTLDRAQGRALLGV
jgi:hypothetical protein